MSQYLIASQGHTPDLKSKNSYSNLFKTLVLALILTINASSSFAVIPFLFKTSDPHTNPFNGKNLTGWGYLEKQSEKMVFIAIDGRKESSDSRFTGKKGILSVNPWNLAKGPHWISLWTVQEYPEDFSLSLEFRASVNADSGIYLRGKQLQCRDYLVAGPYKKLQKYKAQDWNKIEVTVTNNVARCTCNGEVLEEAFQLPPTGRFGLEADRGLMEYRNIKIKSLK
jgi:hypothetical protein